MAENDEDRDSLAPHPFGMPEERRYQPWILVVAIAVVIVVALVAIGVGVYLLRKPAGGPARRSVPGASGQGASAPASAAPQSSASAIASGAIDSSAGVPAASGSKLATLDTPPEHTVAMVVVPRGFQGADFAVVFTPYGLGPSGPAGGVLVAKILSSKPIGSQAKSLRHDFAGQNVTLYCTPAQLSAITDGGRYQGTMRVRPQGDVGVMLLVRASPAQ